MVFRAAVESAIWLFEVAKARDAHALYDRRQHGGICHLTSRLRARGRLGSFDVETF